MSSRQGFYRCIPFIALLLAASVAWAVPSGSAAPNAGTPVFVTTAGQSADAHAVKLLLDRSKIASGYDAVAEADKISGSKTLFLVMGGSSKGLGAAGMNENDEIVRVTRVLEKAKKENIYIVGIHIGGESRRGALSAKFIDLVAPQCSYIIVKQDGNKDGYFTKLGAKIKIPVTVIDETLDLVSIFKTMFAVK
jgi:hypothetical protein